MDALEKLDFLEKKIDDFLATHDNYSLRDYFAGQVLAGMGEYLMCNKEDLDSLVKTCYKIADAMVEVRNEKK